MHRLALLLDKGWTKQAGFHLKIEAPPPSPYQVHSSAHFGTECQFCGTWPGWQLQHINDYPQSCTIERWPHLPAQCVSRQLYYIRCPSQPGHFQSQQQPPWYNDATGSRRYRGSRAASLLLCLYCWCLSCERPVYQTRVKQLQDLSTRLFAHMMVWMDSTRTAMRGQTWYLTVCSNQQWGRIWLHWPCRDIERMPPHTHVCKGKASVRLHCTIPYSKRPQPLEVLLCQ